MYCENCGTQLQDGATFCSNCGYQFNAQAQQPVAPSPLAGGIVKIPGISALISAGIALLTFIFSFLPMIGYSVEYGGRTAYSDSYGIFSDAVSALIDGDNGRISFFLLFAKIFCILGIVVFLAYIATLFVDFKKLLPALKLDIDKLASIAYFGVMALFVLCILIGGVSSESGFGASASLHPAVCWYFELIFVAAGCVLAIKPDLLAKFGIKN